VVQERLQLLPLPAAPASAEWGTTLGPYIYSLLLNLFHMSGAFLY